MSPPPPNFLFSFVFIYFCSHVDLYCSMTHSTNKNVPSFPLFSQFHLSARSTPFSPRRMRANVHDEGLERERSSSAHVRLLHLSLSCDVPLSSSQKERKCARGRLTAYLFAFAESGFLHSHLVSRGKQQQGDLVVSFPFPSDERACPWRQLRTLGEMRRR